jgi:uncharacterized membrane protein (DUF106 family)
MDLTELYHDSFFDGSDLKRDDYHGQALGESVDYDYDRVKVQDAVKERNDKLKKIGAEKRSVKIDLTQKQDLYRMEQVSFHQMKFHLLSSTVVLLAIFCAIVMSCIFFEKYLKK